MQLIDASVVNYSALLECLRVRQRRAPLGSNNPLAIAAEAVGPELDPRQQLREGWRSADAVLRHYSGLLRLKQPLLQSKDGNGIWWEDFSL